MADSLTGLTESEARETHVEFIKGYVAMVVVAVIAHALVWMWRPWIPGDAGYGSASLMENINSIAASLPMIG